VRNLIRDLARDALPVAALMAVMWFGAWYPVHTETNALRAQLLEAERHNVQLHTRSIEDRAAMKRHMDAMEAWLRKYHPDDPDDPKLPPPPGKNVPQKDPVK
jgi:hypothetical protein